jgi:hypothetical protein
MVIDTSTASGAATLNGMMKASSGTATRASPKPNAERISVAIKTMNKTSRVVMSIAYSWASRILSQSVLLPIIKDREESPTKGKARATLRSRKSLYP